MEQKKEFYVGIDIGRNRTMISLYRKDQKEPETISTVRGMEKFGIPLAMFLEKKGTTYYGDEALKRRDQPNGDFFEDIYEGAKQINEERAEVKAAAEFAEEAEAEEETEEETTEEVGAEAVEEAAE